MTGGDLPTNWEKASLAELATVLQGQSPPGSTYNVDGIGLPFLQGSAEFGALSPSPAKWCSEPIRVAERGDILISIRAPVGPTNVADQRYCIGRGLAAIRASHSIEPAFLLHQLRHSVAALVDQATGTTFDAIGGSVLREHAVSVAPLPEQRRIVDAIDSYLTRLDDAVASLERVQAKLKAYRASVLKAAVEGRLVPTEASLACTEKRDFEPAGVLLARILKERRRRWEEAELAKLQAAGTTAKNDKWKDSYEEPVAPDTSRLPELPEGWTWASTEAVAGVVDPQPSHRTPPEIEGGIPYVGMGDVEDGNVKLDEARRVGTEILEEHRSRYSLRVGDFIFGKIGTLGRPALLPQPFGYALSANVVLVQPDPHMARAFHFFWMQSPALNRIVTRDTKATSQPAFGIKKVRALPVPIAPLLEQMRIVEEVERQLSVQLATAKMVNDQLARLRLLRQGILKWAFAGKLVNQDATDEPADRLLARIRAERTAVNPAKKTAGRRTRGAA